MLVYAGGLVADPSTIRLAADELASYRFVEVGELDALLVERLARRVHAALGALAAGGVAELERGVLVRGDASSR